MQELVRLISAVSRSTPHFRGKGRIYRAVNRLALRSRGFDPLVTAQFGDGTRMIVDLRSRTELGCFYEGAYDKFYVDSMCSLLAPESVVLDVGANVGFYAVPIARRLRDLRGPGRVVAFEPLESNRVRLEKNLALNGVESRCKVCDFGLSNETRTVDIALREDFRDGAQTGNASIVISDELDAGFERTTIKVEALDGVWRSLCGDTALDLVKLDIEGHEDFFFRGAAETIRQNRPTIFMEVNKPYYSARHVDMDSVILPEVPPGYEIHARVGRGWRQVRSFSECSVIDNVFLVPVERMTQPRHQLLFRAFSADAPERAERVRR